MQWEVVCRNLWREFSWKAYAWMAEALSVLFFFVWCVTTAVKAFGRLSERLRASEG